LPRTTIARSTTKLSGADLSMVAADSVNGMQFQNNGNQALVVNNASAAGITVTIDFAADRHGRDGTKTISVGAGGEKYIGPFIPELYNQGGYVYVDFSADTSVTVGVLSLQS
jgi:hypothetical protein